LATVVVQDEELAVSARAPDRPVPRAVKCFTTRRASRPIPVIVADDAAYVNSRPTK
jgi:hypothetical protein